MEDREYRQAVQRREGGRRLEQRESSPFKGWSLAGGIALIGVAALVLVALPDIKRYVRISTM